MKGPPNPLGLAARSPVGGPLSGALHRREKISTCALQTWQRLTLPHLKAKYHQRWGVSRPCSEWERVQPPRHNHQVGKEHVVFREAVLVMPLLRRRSFGRSPQGQVAVAPYGAPCPEALWAVRTEKLDHPTCRMGTRNENDQADRAISTGKLHALPHFHTRPINVVVFHGSQGILVLRWVSRLDAFSGYPVRI